MINLCEIENNMYTNEEGTYEIKFPEGPYLMIKVPVEYGSPASRFDHPNIAQTHKEILSFKYYSRSRGKWWVEKPGISYTFIVPKSKIMLNTEKSGYSYVHLQINGQKYVLSVSGGTDGNLWTDYVIQGSSTGVTKSAKHLKPIAEVATLDIVPGITIAHKIMDEHTLKQYNAACNFYDARGKIKEGDKIFLKGGWRYMGTAGPFEVVQRPKRKRYFVCYTGPTSTIKIKYSQIDWTKTAEANGYSRNTMSIA